MKSFVLRDEWKRGRDFVMIILSQSITSVCFNEFPICVMKQGGIVFFISYVIIAAVMGHPLLTLQAYVGQFVSKGPTYAFTGLSPATKGVGYGIIILNIMLCYCSGTHMAYSLFYFHTVVDQDSPWEICADDWQSDCHCYIRPRKFLPPHEVQCIGEIPKCESRYMEEKDDTAPPKEKATPSKTGGAGNATNSRKKEEKLVSRLLKNLHYEKQPLSAVRSLKKLRKSKKRKRQTRYSRIPFRRTNDKIDFHYPLEVTNAEQIISKQSNKSSGPVENNLSKSIEKSYVQIMKTEAKQTTVNHSLKNNNAHLLEKRDPFLKKLQFDSKKKMIIIKKKSNKTDSNKKFQQNEKRENFKTHNQGENYEETHKKYKEAGNSVHLKEGEKIEVDRNRNFNEKTGPMTDPPYDVSNIPLRNISYRENLEGIPQARKMPAEPPTKCYEYPLEASTAQYFRKVVLNMHPSDPFWKPSVNLGLVICFFISWIFVAIVISSGRTVFIVVIYITTVSPIIFFIGLSIRLLWDDLNVTFHALQYYFLERIHNSFKFPQTFLLAVDHVMIQMSVGTGAIISLSSYNRFHYHFPSNSVTANNLSTMGVLILSCTVIICYGSICAKSGLHYNEVDEDDDPMFDIVLDSLFYISTNTKIWEICITICFFFISFNSVILHVDTVCTALIDISGAPNTPTRIFITVCVCTICCLGLVFLCQGGYRIQYIFCHYVRTSSLLFMALIIHLSIYYVFGYEHVQYDHMFMLNRPLNILSRVQYAFLVPILLIIFLIMNEYRNPLEFYLTEKPYPLEMKIVSFLISLLPFIPVLVIGCFTRIDVKKKEDTVVPYYLITELWGPGRLPDYVRYVDYLDFKEEGMTRLRDKATIQLYGIPDPEPVVQLRNTRRWKLKPGQEVKIPPSRLADAGETPSSAGQPPPPPPPPPK